MGVLNMLKRLLVDVKPLFIGRSVYINVQKTQYRSILDATALKAGWVSKDELMHIINTGVLNDRKAFIIIPFFADDPPQLKAIVEEVGRR